MCENKQNEEAVVVCKACGMRTSELGREDDVPFEINAGFADRFTICFGCHRELMEHGAYTACESCGAYFTPDHLLPNKEDADNTPEICPYCGQVWCG